MLRYLSLALSVNLTSVLSPILSAECTTGTRQLSIFDFVNLQPAVKICLAEFRLCIIIYLDNNRNPEAALGQYFRAGANVLRKISLPQPMVKC
jgi:hypothetical protein